MPKTQCHQTLPRQWPPGSHALNAEKCTHPSPTPVVSELSQTPQFRGDSRIYFIRSWPLSAVSTSQLDPEVPSSVYLYCCLFTQALRELPWAPTNMEWVPKHCPRWRCRENTIARTSRRDVQPIQLCCPSLMSKTADSSLSVAFCEHLHRHPGPDWPSDSPFQMCYMSLRILGLETPFPGQLFKHSDWANDSLALLFHGRSTDTWFLSECVENNYLIRSWPWLPRLALTSPKSSCVSSSVTTWFRGQSILICLRVEDDENQPFNFCLTLLRGIHFYKTTLEIQR